MSLSKTARVFFSSTFRDMAGERTCIVSRSIPQLRRRLAKRGVYLAEVDLRWGVTAAQVADGAVVERCLAEVEAAHPYFVGVLGDSYGTTVSTFHPDLCRRWPWLADCIGLSLTEIEITLGALQTFNPNARFYFKRSNHISALSARLRQRIIAFGYQPRFYTDLESLEHLVHADLWSLLKNEALEIAHDNSSSFSVRWHDTLARGMHPVLDRTDDILREIECVEGAVALVSDDDSERAASLASLCRALVARGHTSFLYVATATPLHSNPRNLLKHLQEKLLTELRHVYAPCREVTRGFEISVSTMPISEPSNPRIYIFDGAGKCGPVVQDILQGADREIGPITLVLDGFDHLGPGDDPCEIIPDPTNLMNIRVILGVRRAVLLTKATNLGYKIIDIGRLAEPQVFDLTSRYFARHGKLLERDLSSAISRTPAATDSLYIRLLLERIKSADNPVTLAETTHKLLRAENVEQLIALIIEDVIVTSNNAISALMKMVLEQLAVCRFGVRLETIHNLASTVTFDESPASLWGRVREILGSLLLETFSSTHRTSSGTGYRPCLLYRLSGAVVETAVNRIVLEDPTLRTKIHAESASSYIGNPDLESWSELAWHLWKSGRWERLSRILIFTPLIEEAWIWDADLILKYCHDLEVSRSICIADEIIDRYSTDTDVPVPNTIVEFLCAIKPGAVPERIIAFRDPFLKREMRPFSWTQQAMSEMCLADGDTDQTEIGPYFDDLEKAENSNNAFIVALCKNRLGRYRSLIGQNAEAIELFTDARRLLQESRLDSISVFVDGPELLRKEMLRALMGERDSALLLGMEEAAESLQNKIELLRIFPADM